MPEANLAAAINDGVSLALSSCISFPLAWGNAGKKESSCAFTAFCFLLIGC